MTAVTFDAHFDEVNRAFKRKMKITIGAIALIFLYFTGSVIQFELFNIGNKWNPDRANMFLLDTYAHKDHVTMKWKNPGVVEAAFEGGYRHVYDPLPEWMERDASAGTSTVNFDNGGQIIFYADQVQMVNWPGEDQDYTFRIGANGKPEVVGFEGRRDALPEWMRWTENKVEVRPSLFERLQVFRTKVEVHRYAIGWKYFWFDFDSPLRDTGLLAAIGLMFSNDRIIPELSNADLVLIEFLNNDLWHHGTVLFALVETLVMAVMGTLIASLLGLPLAFLAARNITPFAPLRLALRRLFDFLRGIDMLIWSLIFLRAFGPGVFTGIFAIAFTDTGTLGKLMSEAIENTDGKQKEGIQSTGATRVQQHRYGVIPQILPIFISQSLYYLESNTRSAVIIGAMGAGGIGLQFLGALQTGNDFENVGYMALLVLFTVIMMDMGSAWLRKRLIGIESN